MEIRLYDRGLSVKCVMLLVCVLVHVIFVRLQVIRNKGCHTRRWTKLWAAEIIANVKNCGTIAFFFFLENR